MPKSDIRYVDFKVVKDRVSIIDILERYGLMQSLRKVNDDQYTGQCPIHKGDNKTAFRVSVSKNCWNCFSTCKSGGNILDFVAKMEDVTVRQAAQMIAEWFNLEDAYKAPDSPKTDKSERKRPAKAAPADKPAPKPKKEPETEDTSITSNSILGFALKNLDSSHDYLRERGLTEETIATFGLGFCNKGVMRGRVVIPIHNANGMLVAYAGRWPGDAPNDTEKYKLPKGFRKSLEVFNLHRAMEEDRTKPLYIVEGFFDCMKLWQAGYRRVVALMGSNLSDAQAKAIIEATKNCDKIVVIFDEDDAGREGRVAALAKLATAAYVRVLPFLEEGMQPDGLESEEIDSMMVEEDTSANGYGQPKFSPGQIVSTRTALATLDQEDIRIALGRHLRGDWGDVCNEDRQSNEEAIREGFRLLSVYYGKSGTKFWIITEADRSVTTVLLPEDY